MRGWIWLMLGVVVGMTASLFFYPEDLTIANDLSLSDALQGLLTIGAAVWITAKLTTSATNKRVEKDRVISEIQRAIDQVIVCRTVADQIARSASNDPTPVIREFDSLSRVIWKIHRLMELYDLLPTWTPIIPLHRRFFEDVLNQKSGEYRMMEFSGKASQGELEDKLEELLRDVNRS